MSNINVRPTEISIHAPRVGSDFERVHKLHTVHNFNPRSPCGERQLPVIEERLRAIFQSTLPVWGATVHALSDGAEIGISIHAPRVGSDPVMRSSFSMIWRFQSTLPVWGATCFPLSINDFYGADFNPRSPCGERP